jgi:hypothetical protein
MTDAEWFSCDDPDRMLTALGDAISDRKLLLFACGCLRHVEGRLPPAVRGVADGFERAADGTAASTRKSILWNLAAALGGDPAGVAAFAYGLVPLGARLLGRQVVAAARAVELADPETMTAPAAISTRHPGQAALLRELHGPTFVRPAFDPAWRTDPVAGLARAAYEQKAFDRLPILADALEDAGCDEPIILTHCRDATLAHAKGCWVVDLTLGLE